MRPNGEYSSGDEDDQEGFGEEIEEEEEEDEEEEDEEEAERPMGGPLLVNRRLLHATMKETESNQRENLFQTRALVQGKTCSVIIDGGSCTNVASQDLVDKLGLKTYPHTHPYSLQWMDEGTNVKVSKRVTIPFQIGRYKDVVQCDVVKMKATHILLGRPWQYDREATHFGRENKYSLLHGERKFTLLPLTPLQALQDQLQLQSEEERQKSETSGVSKREDGKKGQGPLREDKRERDPRGKREQEGKQEGLPLLAKEKHIKKALLGRKPCLLFIPSSCLLTNDNASSLPSCVSTILQEFDDVFGEPTSLPPYRGIEH